MSSEWLENQGNVVSKRNRVISTGTAGRGVMNGSSARAEGLSPDEVGIVNVINRVVRRCFLFGTDSVSGKNHDHRKGWIEDLLKLFAAQFGIDLLGFAVISNHFHLVLCVSTRCGGHLGGRGSRSSLADDLSSSKKQRPPFRRTE